MYNVRKYLERCLNNFAAQINFSPADYELILVNDGSTDGTAEVAKEFVLKHNELNISILTQENQGLSQARNAGLRLAQGEYVWFVDSDDWVSETALTKLESSISKHKPDVIHFRALNHPNFRDIRIRRKPYENIDSPMSGRDLFLKYNWEYCATFYVYRRRYLLEQKLGFYPGIYHEDNEFTPRMLYQAGKALIINDTLYHVFQNPYSITRTVNPKKSFDIITVAKRLFDYAEDNVPQGEYRTKFHNVIADTMNWALISAANMSRDDVRRLNRAFRSEKYLFYAYRHSSLFRFRLLGFLFAICPEYVFIINFLRRFKRS